MIRTMHTWAEPDLYLMADENVVEQTQNVERNLCPIVKNPDPVLTPDRPWEGATGEGPVDCLQDPFYGVVLYDAPEKRFRCWYNAYNRFLNRANYPPMANQGSSCCFAISSDGVHWDKPPLRQVLFNASYENNMVRFMDRAATMDCSVLAEQVWSVFPYHSKSSDDFLAASLMTTYNDSVYKNGITVCYSADGLHWRMHYPPVLPLDGDCHSMCWDPNLECFLVTTRSFQHANLSRRWNRPWKRHIALGKSRDLHHWTPLHTVLEVDDQDPEDAQMYMMHIVPYGHGYIGQLLMFYTNEMVLENQLAFSRDLKHWQRVGDRKPFLARGSEGSWDSKHVALTNNVPHPEEKNMRFWFGGKSAPHYQAGYGAMGTGTLRRDGFVCYEAGEEEGIVTTLPVKVNGATQLSLNVDASDGVVLVEIVDKKGTPIQGCTRQECHPIHGDHSRIVVNFEAGPGQFFDRGNFFRFPEQVRFRFFIKKAKLYAFKAPRLTPDWPKPGEKRTAADDVIMA